MIPHGTLWHSVIPFICLTRRHRWRSEMSRLSRHQLRCHVASSKAFVLAAAHASAWYVTSDTAINLPQRNLSRNSMILTVCYPEIKYILFIKLTNWSIFLRYIYNKCYRMLPYPVLSYLFEEYKYNILCIYRAPVYRSMILWVYRTFLVAEIYFKDDLPPYNESS